MAKPKNWQFTRHDCPPPTGDVLHVTRVRETGHVSGIIITPTIIGFMTHWHNRRTRPCPGRDKGCKLCLDLMARRWVGFIQWCNTDHTGHTALELTPNGGHFLKEIQDRDGSLRGLIIRVGRSRPDLKGAQLIDIIGRDPDLDSLMMPKPIEPTLNRLWGYTA